MLVAASGSQRFKTFKSVAVGMSAARRPHTASRPRDEFSCRRFMVISRRCVVSEGILSYVHGWQQISALADRVVNDRAAAKQKVTAAVGRDDPEILIRPNSRWFRLCPSKVTLTSGKRGGTSQRWLALAARMTTMSSATAGGI